MRKIYLMMFLVQAILFCTVTHADDYYKPLTINSENEKLLKTKSNFCQAVGDEDELLSNEKKTTRTYKRKNYFIAVGFSIVPFVGPVIGHSYIGGKNILRGVIYTVGELSFFISAFGGGNDFISTEVLIDSFFLTYFVNITDAFFSVKRRNIIADESKKKLLIIPDFNSRGLRLAWSF